MFRLIYTSSACWRLSPRQVANIANVCGRKNRRVGLTGILVAHQGQFFQILEGDEDALYRCANLIRRDPRHGRFRVIEAQKIDARAFADWTFVHESPQLLGLAGAERVAELREIMPMNSPLRGRDPEVRRKVRDFLASFDRLLAA